MEITLPKIIEKKIEGAEGEFEISPLAPGFGITIANSLRRVLLGYLEGAAVDRVKIKGVDHEFSTIEGMQEDVLAFLLNLKNLRLKTEGEAVLKLKAKGPKAIYAKDISAPGGVEIINKDLYLATLNKKGTLEASIYVKRGIGYVTQEEKVEEEKINNVSREIGVILLDSLFSPIKKVNFRIENVRVGRRTDYEKVILTVITDGTLAPKEAITQASEILTNHFVALKDIKKEEEAKVKKELKKKEDKKEELGRRPIAELNLSTRTTNALINAGVKTIGGLLKYKDEQELLQIDGLGAKGVKEIQYKIKKILK